MVYAGRQVVPISSRDIETLAVASASYFVYMGGKYF